MWFQSDHSNRISHALYIDSCIRRLYVTFLRKTFQTCQKLGNMSLYLRVSRLKSEGTGVTAKMLTSFTVYDANSLPRKNYWTFSPLLSRQFIWL